MHNWEEVPALGRGTVRAMAVTGKGDAKDSKRFLFFAETVYFQFRFCVLFLIILFVNGASNGSSNGGETDQYSDRIEAKRSTKSSYLKDVTGEFGVLYAQYGQDGNATEESYCIYHYNGNYVVKRKKDAKFLHVKDELSLNASSLCVSPEAKNAPDSLVLLHYDSNRNCTLSHQAAAVESLFAGSRGVLIVVPHTLDVKDVKVESNSTKDPYFIVALISNKSALDITSRVAENPKLRVVGFDQESLSFDYSYLVIWLIAVTTVCVGSFWSGVVRADLYAKKQLESELKISSRADRESRRKDSALDEEPYLNISPVWVLAFVVCMAMMLLALYFFYNYLVYVIIGLFVIASMMSTFACIDQVAKIVMPNSWLSLSINTRLKPPQKPVYQIFILIFAIALPLTWLITRKENYSWVLQDILGILFSVNMLRTIRLPSFKICFVLLSLLFFYDIFFVFITPMITSKGESVMVEVATGGGKYEGNGSGSKVGEQLPMVLRVPHLAFRNQSDPADVCLKVTRSYSLLGFGDILVPGLLVSYCHAFDIIHKVPKKLYFIISCISYGLGLIATFFGLYFMNGIPQPALLYLVPFTVIPLVVTALIRKELRKFWSGPGDGSRDDSSWGKEAERIAGNASEDNSLLTNAEEPKNGANPQSETLPAAL